MLVIMNNLSKKDRINMVFSSLKENGDIHNQADLAKAIGASEATISKALKGEEKALTDNLFKRISKRFVKYSLDWMVNGVGSMLNGCGCPPSTVTDQSFYHPSDDGTCNGLATEEEGRKSGMTKDERIRFLEAQLASRDNLLAEKERTIQILLGKSDGIA